MTNDIVTLNPISTPRYSGNFGQPSASQYGAAEPVHAQILPAGDSPHPAEIVVGGIDSAGSYRAAKVGRDGKLEVSASLSVGDISIGAVEIKDATSDTRASVYTAGDALSTIRGMVPLVRNTDSGSFQELRSRNNGLSTFDLINSSSMQELKQSIPVDHDIIAANTGYSGSWSAIACFGVTFNNNATDIQTISGGKNYYGLNSLIVDGYEIKGRFTRLKIGAGALIAYKRR